MKRFIGHSKRHYNWTNNVSYPIHVQTFKSDTKLCLVSQTSPVNYIVEIYSEKGKTKLRFNNYKKAIDRARGMTS